MRALTLWPEWAWAIAHLGKDVENRIWAPPSWLIGQTLAIHAGKNVGGKPGCKSYHLGTTLVRETAISAGLDPSPLAEWVNKLHRELCNATSAVVAVARVEAECERCEPSRWSVEGQRHWRLHDVVALREPVRCRGAQGLWVLPADIETNVREQLARRG
jgi:hypothetical protein